MLSSIFIKSTRAVSASSLKYSARVRSVSSLIVAEIDGNQVSQGTLACVTAAKKIGGDIALLISGHNVSEVASKASKIAGVGSVLTIDQAKLAHPVAEDLSKSLVSVSKGFTHILTPASNTGKNFMPRLGALLDLSPISDVIEVVDKDTFKRPMYAGSVIATVKMSDAIKLILVRPTAFDKAATEGGNANVSSVNVTADESNASLSSFVSANIQKSARPDLGSARVVVSGGRGMKNGENFQLLEKLADKLSGAVGASRAAVDAGYVPNEYQIGQTGKVVAPDLYIAVGISGAIQHLSGMKDSKVIVAINKDKEAPIFQVSDYGLVDDLFKAVPELTNKV